MRSVHGWRCPAWVAYLVVAAVTVGAYFVVPVDTVKTTLYGLIGLSSAAVTVVGVRRYRPLVRWPWYLMALGRVCFAAGDVSYWVQSVVLHHDVFPSYSDLLYCRSARSGPRRPV